MKHLALLTVLVFAPACAVQRQMRSNALEYLYPPGSPTVPAQDVTLRLPVRVGVAFAPAQPGGYGAAGFSEQQKQALLEKVAGRFRGREGIGSIEVLPATHLTLQGGFEELARVKQAFGVDLVALLSYDQFQFSGSGRISWTYWTILGAYVVKGEKNETRTLMDAVVYDVDSRTMILNASGQDRLAGSSTPVDLELALREASARGFERATEDLVGRLDAALADFQARAQSGTVRGVGSPALALVDERGQPVEGGAGLLGVADALGALALLGLAATARRRG